MHMRVDCRWLFPEPQSYGTIASEVGDESSNIMRHNSALVRDFRICNSADEKRCEKIVSLQVTRMDYQQIEKLTQRGNTTPEAIHRRLVATRLATELTQKQLAALAGIKYTTFRSQEQAGSPSVAMMSFYLSTFQVDFNFILGGDPSRLPADIRDAILHNLSELEAK